MKDPSSSKLGNVWQMLNTILYVLMLYVGILTGTPRRCPSCEILVKYEEPGELGALAVQVEKIGDRV